ncbi:MAG: cyclic nucleotide-binding/CBS domain-containing protein [Candidatus Bathyarchaeia archaeon]
MASLAAKDVMIKKLVRVSPETTLTAAARLMVRRDVGSVLVMRGNRLIGILTKSDFVRIAPKTEVPNKVKEVMSAPVITCGPDKTVLEIIHLMQKNRIRHVPITDGDRVVGIVTDYDLACYATSQLNKVLTMIKPPKA